MRPTLLLRAHVHTPMIKFIGQRSRIQPGPHAPAPHPAAPPEIAESFQSFLAKLQSSSGGVDSPSSTPKGQSTAESARGKVSGGDASGAGAAGASGKSSKPADYENFWDAPGRLWQIKELSEREIEAVMSGGATDIRSGP
ncbi:hypothetical protein Q5752_006633 [Cryptotrichosporon argae]